MVHPVKGIELVANKPPDFGAAEGAAARVGGVGEEGRDDDEGVLFHDGLQEARSRSK